MFEYLKNHPVVTIIAVVVVIVAIIILIGRFGFGWFVKKDSYYGREPDANVYQLIGRGVTSTTPFTPPEMRP